ncbi:uncharacterized protein LOC142608763 [Castanea sativa]|uniref:uncharacterized protein LOC142608763 n=1 Tax=Castanea sativa TaxID=21020 RepID=UPI003F64B3D8
MGENAREVSGSLVWAKLWKLKIPNKIRVFGWRTCLDIQPTHVNLARWKILADDRCGVCLQAKESGYHVLWECGLAQDIWAGCSSRLQKGTSSYEDMLQLVEHMQQRQTDEELELFWAHLTVSDTCVLVQKWHPPSGSFYKLNFDATVFSDTCSTRFGAIIRNNLGEVMVAMSAKGLGVMDSEEAEVLACQRALEFAVDAGFEELVIEGDNSTVINSIASLRALQSRLGNIYGDIRLLAAGSKSRYARSIDKDIFSMEESPPPAIEALYLDSLSLNE